MLWIVLSSSAVSFTGGRGRPTSKRRLDGGLSLTRDLDSALLLRVYAVDRVDDDTLELGAVAFDLLVRRGDDRVLLREVGEEFLVARLAAVSALWRRAASPRSGEGCIAIGAGHARPLLDATARATLDNRGWRAECRRRRKAPTGTHHSAFTSLVAISVSCSI